MFQFWPSLETSEKFLMDLEVPCSGDFCVSESRIFFFSLFLIPLANVKKTPHMSKSCVGHMAKSILNLSFKKNSVRGVFGKN